MAMQVKLTLPESLYARARRLAHLRRQDVNEVITELLDEALPPDNGADEADDSLEEGVIDREMAAYVAMHPTLKQKYMGMHVAIQGATG